MKVTKQEFEQAALDHTCYKCGRVFKTVRDTKIHMIKIHVMEKNSYYLTFKEDASNRTHRPTLALDRRKQRTEVRFGPDNQLGECCEKGASVGLQVSRMHRRTCNP